MAENSAEFQLVNSPSFLHLVFRAAGKPTSNNKPRGMNNKLEYFLLLHFKLCVRIYDIQSFLQSGNAVSFCCMVFVQIWFWSFPFLVTDSVCDSWVQHFLMGVYSFHFRMTCSHPFSFSCFRRFCWIISLPVENFHPLHLQSHFFLTRSEKANYFCSRLPNLSS